MRSHPVVVHIGHDFYGAGNIGDDLMMAGFLAALEPWPEVRLTCCCPHDRAAQQRRFPRVVWLPGDLASRRAAICAADVWLGLGGSPFQSDDGDWCTRHLLEEAALCAASRVPMDFLGVGVNDVAALRDPRLWTVLAQARQIVTRDGRSARLLSPHRQAGVGADLAHVALSRRTAMPAALPTSLAAAQVGREGLRLGLCLAFHEALAPHVTALESLLDRLSACEVVALVGEVRRLPQGERMLLAGLAPRYQQRLHEALPDYAAATWEAMLTGLPACDHVVSSRYHMALLQAWAGARVGVLAINDKLLGLADDLSVPAFASLDEVQLEPLVQVERRVLGARAARAAEMVATWVQALPRGGEAVERGDVGQATRVQSALHSARSRRIGVLALDSLGDQVLRQPLLSALLDAGHAVTVVARPAVTGLLPFIDPRLKVLQVTLDPYRIVDPQRHANELARLVAELAGCHFHDVLLPCYNRTLLDEAVLRALPHARRVGYAKGVPVPLSRVHLEVLLAELPPQPRQARLDVEVHATKDMHECDKYAMLGHLAYGLAVEGQAPRLDLPESLVEQALAEVGLGLRSYVALCPLGTVNVPLKAMPTRLAVAAAGALTRQAGLEVLLLGAEEERAGLESVRAACAADGVRARVWSGQPEQLGTLLGLLAAARLYVGGDSGPMHMAAALGVPVVAAFGGGTWPRFTPRGASARVLVHEMTCFGCLWSCPYPKPPCFERLQSADLVQAALDLLASSGTAP